MTVKVFLAVLYLWLTFTSSVKGQYFPGRPRNRFNPQSQPSRNPFAQPFNPQNFAPGSQSSGFNHNPQEKYPQNVHQAPNFNSFPPPTFSSYHDFSSLNPQSSSLFPPAMDQPPSFAPQRPVPYNPTFNPQRPSSGFPYPQQNSPFNHGAPGPGSNINNPQQTNPFYPGSIFNNPRQDSPFNPGAQGSGPMFNNPQQSSPFNHGAQGPGPMFNNPQQSSPSNHGPQIPSTMFNNPQQASPFNHGSQGPGNIFSNPHPTDSFFTRPQQARSFRHPPTPLLPTPTDAINQTALRLLEEEIEKAVSTSQHPQQTSPLNTQPTFFSPTPTKIINPTTSRYHATNPFFTDPEKTYPSFTNLQKTIPTSPGPPQTNSDPTTPQQLYQDSTGSQQSNSNSTVPQQTASDSSVPQTTYSDSTAPQSTTSDLAVAQPTDTGSTVSQKPTSDLAAPQQPASDSIIYQKPTSDSEVPQPTDSMSTLPQKPSSESEVIQPTVPQQSVSDSTIPPQPESNSTVLQQPDSEQIAPQQPTSDSIGPQKTVAASDDVQPITSASEASSSVSNAPQDSGSVYSAPQKPVHISHNRSSTTQYIGRSGKQTNFRDPLRGFRIVCLFNNRHYFRNNFTPAKIPPHLCTHVNYEFAVLDKKTHEMIISEPDLDMGLNFYEEVIGLKHMNPHLKVLVSLGGWSDSTKKYSELASDSAKRANFVDKAVQFLLKHEFDGLDLAWEYPNCWQGAIGISPQDKPNFVALLKDIREGFDKYGLILSVSVGAIKREVEAAYDVPAIANIVDYINVMTYDMHGPWEPVTGHHVQFEGKPGDKDPYCNVKGGMQVWTEKGAPRKKLNMGLALYGRTFTLQNPNQCGMGVPAAGPGDPGKITNEGGIMNYHEICGLLNNGTFVEKEDPQSGFYACSKDGQWACYDPPVMMVRKAKYVVNSGLGGVLLKDLSGDDCDGNCFNMPYPCLKMVKLEMVHSARRKYP